MGVCATWTWRVNSFKAKEFTNRCIEAGAAFRMKVRKQAMKHENDGSLYQVLTIMIVTTEHLYQGFDCHTVCPRRLLVSD